MIRKKVISIREEAFRVLPVSSFANREPRSRFDWARAMSRRLCHCTALSVLIILVHESYRSKLQIWDLDLRRAVHFSQKKRRPKATSRILLLAECDITVLLFGKVRLRPEETSIPLREDPSGTCQCLWRKKQAQW